MLISKSKWRYVFGHHSFVKSTILHPKQSQRFECNLCTSDMAARRSSTTVPHRYRNAFRILRQIGFKLKRSQFAASNQRQRTSKYWRLVGIFSPHSTLPSNISTPEILLQMFPHQLKTSSLGIRPVNCICQWVLVLVQLRWTRGTYPCRFAGGKFFPRAQKKQKNFERQYEIRRAANCPLLLNDCTHFHMEMMNLFSRAGNFPLYLANTFLHVRYVRRFLSVSLLENDYFSVTSAFHQQCRFVSMFQFHQNTNKFSFQST